MTVRRKVAKQCFGPYKGEERLGPVAYVTKSKAGGRLVRDHADRLTRIGRRVTEKKRAL